MHAVDLTKAFAAIHQLWTPHIVGELNGQRVKCTKLRGEFIWHHHEHEDEMFLVHRRTMEMRLRDRTIALSAGQFLIVPRGVEHQPYAAEETEVVLFEPAATLNTGNIRNERTVEVPKRLDVV